MQTYEIIVTPDAENDLIDLRDYITYELLSPDIAVSYIREIRAEIAKLEYLAPSIAIFPDEPFHSMGIRRITANNFIVYFWINDETRTVFVLNVIYKRRDQLQALKHLTSN